MTLIKEFVCLSCKHYIFGNRCAAFPQGIPADILAGRSNHIEPREGDHGIQFSPRKRGALRETDEDRTLIEPTS